MANALEDVALCAAAPKALVMPTHDYDSHAIILPLGNNVGVEVFGLHG